MTTADPIIVAHRGLAGHAPENTLAAYGAALDLGFGLEVDLSVTADGQIVMIHDRSLDRTTDGQGPVGEKTALEVQALDAGSWFHPSFSDQRIPTLDEALAFIRHRLRVPTLVALDLKSSGHSLEAEIVRLVEERGLRSQALAIGATIQSRDVRRRFKGLDPGFFTAILLDSPDEWYEGMAEESADWLYLRFIPTEQQVFDAHEAGKRILKAGPLPDGGEIEKWRSLRDVGVDAILTDYPLECRRALRD